MTTQTADRPLIEPRAIAQPSSEVRSVAMPVVDRLASAVITAAPPILLAVGIGLGWGGQLVNWQDIVNLVVSYVVIGSGITVGFHRLLTHRSYKTSRLQRAGF